MTNLRRAAAFPAWSVRQSASLVLACLVLTTFGPSAWSQDPIPATDLSTRYHLVEQYTSKDPRGIGGATGQSQVVFREKISSDGMNQEPHSRTFRFTERPASVSPNDERVINELVRHYQSMKTEPDTGPSQGKQRLLENLQLWCRIGSSKDTALVVVLTPDRTLSEWEKEFAINHNFVSHLTYVLNDLPVRVGDSWSVSSEGVDALMNLPNIQEGKLTARLAEIVPHTKTPGRQLATLEISGRVSQLGQVDVAMRAQLFFNFAPKRGPATGEVAATEGMGFVEKVLLTQTAVRPAAGSAPKQTYKRELILERRVPGDAAPLAIPEPPPTPTPANSWLTIADPKGQYNFRHPQRFELDRNPTLPNGDPRDPNLLIIQSVKPGSFPDLVQFVYSPSGEIRPDTVFQQLKGDWKASGVTVLEGLTHRLPDVEWPGMAVHHLEAALTQNEVAPQANARRYVDAYVIQFTRNVTMLITATTFSEERAEFRKEVEGMLKTLKLGAATTP